MGAVLVLMRQRRNWMLREAKHSAQIRITQLIGRGSWDPNPAPGPLWMLLTTKRLCITRHGTSSS